MSSPGTGLPPRIDYDLAGAIFIGTMYGSPTTRQFNAYGWSGWNHSVQRNFSILLGQPHDIYAVYAPRGGDISTVAVSSDTTDGTDGTWTNVGYSGTPDTPWATDSWRTSIFTLASPALNTVGIRFRTGSFEQNTAYGFHLYGYRSSNASIDCLRIWDPSSDQLLANLLDFGPVARGYSASGTFRIKNTSATLTASGVTASIDVNGDWTPSVNGALQISDDGSAWGSAVTIGDLTPGTISDVLTAKWIVASDARIGQVAQRIVADAAGWS